MSGTCLKCGVLLQTSQRAKGYCPRCTAHEEGAADELRLVRLEILRRILAYRKDEENVIRGQKAVALRALLDFIERGGHRK